MNILLICMMISLALITGTAVHAAEAVTKKSVTVVTEKVVTKSAADKSGTGVTAGKTDTAAKKEKEPQQTDAQKADMIEQTIDFGIQEERAKAVGRILTIKDPAVKARLVRKLLEVMKDEQDPELLIKSLTVLGELKESSAVPLMTDKVDHTSEDVRIAAVYGIKKTGGVSAKPKLIEKLKDTSLEENSNYTIALLQTLAEFNAVELIPFVKDSLADSKTHQGIKEELVLFLGRVPSPDSREILLKLYRDEEEDLALRSYAVNSLSKLGAKESAGDIKEIIAAIESYDAKKRKKYYTLHLYSIAALARLGDPEAVPKLINALRSNSAAVRLKAISLIKDFKDKRTIDILKYKMNHDQNARVRREAKNALKEMGVDVEEKKEEGKKQDAKK